MRDMIAIVLAAGKGTRMKSEIPKVLHDLLGKPMLQHLLDSILAAGVNEIIVIAGHGAKLLKKTVKDARIAVQKELLGSGDAVNTAKKILGRYSGDILVAYGDTPLIQDETITNLITKHKNSKASATLLTAELKDPRGYGRIIRDDDGNIVKIVEETEASLYEEVIKEINVGLYCFNAKDLFDSLEEVRPENKKKEYFLTDIIAILHKNRKIIESTSPKDIDEIIGVNTRIGLAEASVLLKRRIMEDLMANGVTIEDPASTTIYPGVKIGKETRIYPNTIIESDVEIGEACHVGPFAHIRPGVRLGNGVEIGNFVELVRTKVGSGTKVKHHTYLGDAVVGNNVNVGAGTITANYDGKEKFRTIIEDGAFIGVGAILIAPLRIGSRATVGAGCVVPKNHNVPKGATVVGIPARVFKKNKER